MGMPLDALTLTEATERVLEGLADGHGGAVLTPNVDIMRQYQRSPTLRRVFETTELLVPDGVPLVWASWLQGTPVPQRITGTDMFWAATAAAAARRASVFLAGGHPGVARRTADRIGRVHPGLRVDVQPCYVGPGPIAPRVEDLVHAVLAAAPGVVHLGLPFATQVHLIATLRSELPRTWFVGVGSTFHLVNGDRRRAPEWLQRLGLEWAHRVVHEPRVWRRYLIEDLPVAVGLGFHALRVRALRRLPPVAPPGGRAHIPGR